MTGHQYKQVAENTHLTYKLIGEAPVLFRGSDQLTYTIVSLYIVYKHSLMLDCVHIPPGRQDPVQGPEGSHRRKVHCKGMNASVGAQY